MARGSLNLTRIDTGLYPTNFIRINVTGEEGRPVENLKKEDFKVTENGKEQKVLELVQSNDKFGNTRIVMMIDTSSSMEESLPDVKKAASAFIDCLFGEDQVAVLAFSSSSLLVSDFTSDPASVKASIEGLRAMGETSLYDSTLRAIDMLQEKGGDNCAVIVLTDGVDTASGNGLGDGLTMCIKKSREAGVPIYTIGLGNEANQFILQKLADSTGGIFKAAPSSADLEEIYKALGSQIKKQAWLKYTACRTAWPGTVVNVTVRLENRNIGIIEKSITYKVPVQWWKLILSYLMIESAFVVLTYFVFRLLWKKIGLNPVAATNLSIIILIIATLIWYSFIFIRFVPFYIFIPAAILQLLLLAIPIKKLAG